MYRENVPSYREKRFRVFRAIKANWLDYEQLEKDAIALKNLPPHGYVTRVLYASRFHAKGAERGSYS